MTPTRESILANLVLTLEEITSLAAQEGKPADTLMNVVALIATRFKTDVCSAYLLATRSLKPGACRDAGPSSAKASARCACP